LAIIGGDSRRSTAMLAGAVAAGLAAEGVDVIDVGLVPTPVVAAEAARLDAIGLVVSASHNPHHDNGIKVFGAGGVKLDSSTESQIEAQMASDSVTAGEPGIITTDDPEAVINRHLARLVNVIDNRSLSGLRLVVDTANGAASRIAGPILAALGASVVVMNAEPDGYNINDQCGATDPRELATRVVAEGADIGVALDGDADRMIAVDAAGRVIDGDHLIAICALDMASRGELESGAVVVTVMANLGFRIAMEAAGVDVIETPVGDRHVLEALNAGGHAIGGEQSGHVIWPAHATTGDGLLTAIKLLDVMARSGRSLADLADGAMTSLPQVLLNVPVTDRSIDAEALLASEIEAANGQLAGTGRILIRPSGTEPLIRIMVEAPSDAIALSVASSLAQALEAAAGAPAAPDHHR
jgi:phosphoglucosamine mutase